jgi:hypothetical protein
MKPRRSYTRHGLTAPMVRIKLAGFSAIDRRTAAARATLAFKHELIAALGGEAQLSPQRRKLIDMVARASLLLDHVDAWLFQQRSLVNARAKTLLPVLVQRQAIADHLTRLLDKLGLDRHGPTSVRQSAVVILPDNGRDRLPSGADKLGLDRVSQKAGPASVGGAVVIIPDNGRDALPGRATNVQHPAHQSPESESTAERAIVELPPRDVGEVMSANEDQRHDDLNDLERELGLG